MEPVNRVAAIIIADQGGAAEYNGSFIIPGDFNDYRETDPDGTTTSLDGLVEHVDLVEVVEAVRDADDRWTYLRLSSTYHPGIAGRRTAEST